MHLILFHVEFENELSISVLKNKATYLKKLPLEIEKFLKKQNVFKSPPAEFISHPASFNLTSANVAVGQDLTKGRMSETCLKE
jgi:hypothetical protein